MGSYQPQTASSSPLFPNSRLVPGLPQGRFHPHWLPSPQTHRHILEVSLRISLTAALLFALRLRALEGTLLGLIVGPPDIAPRPPSENSVALLCARWTPSVRY